MKAVMLDVNVVKSLYNTLDVLRIHGAQTECWSPLLHASATTLCEALAEFCADVARHGDRDPGFQSGVFLHDCESVADSLDKFRTSEMDPGSYKALAMIDKATSIRAFGRET